MKTFSKRFQAGGKTRIEKQSFSYMEVAKSSQSYELYSDSFWIFSALSKGWFAIFVGKIAAELCFQS